MRKILLIVLAAAFACAPFAAAHAQDRSDGPPAAKAPAADKIQLHSWMKEFRRRENLAILFGNVRLTKGGLRILADAAVAWFREDGSGVGEIYVEGNLLITDGRDVISALSAYYNFDTGRVTISDAWIQTTQTSLSDLTSAEWVKESGPAPRPKGKLGLYLRAKKVRTERPTRYVGEELTLSTCDSPRPHWGIRSRKGVIYPDGTFEASGNRLFIGPVSIPFFNVRFEPDWRMPLYRLNTGSSSDKGNFTLSRWQLVIDRNYRLFCDFDSYQKNGFGRGALFEYEGRTKRPWLGYLEHYEVDDRDAPAGVKTYRYRNKFLHMHNFSPNTGLTLEYSETSDLNFLKQFFEREYTKGREQETYAYLRKTEDNLGLRLLVSGRTENFRTVTQYQPSVRANAISRDIAGGFYMSASIRNEKILRQYARSMYLPDDEVERHDILASVDRPVTLGKYLNLKPSLTGRYTHYNVNITDSQNVDREIVTVACTADTQLSRTYSTSVNWLRIDGLKHVIEPKIDYENTYHNDTDPARLHQLDEVDALAKGERFMFSLSNRLDTRRKVKDRRTVVNLLDWRLRIPYYPKPLRDNGGVKAGPLESRLEVAATPYLTIRSDLAYNTRSRHMSTGSANVTVRNPEVWQLYLGAVYAIGKDSIGTAGLSANLSRKWQVSIRLQHNLTAGRYVSKTFTLTRTFHCWIMELGLVLERDKDDPTFMFMLSPAALFKKEKLKFTEESLFVK